MYGWYCGVVLVGAETDSASFLFFTSSFHVIKSIRDIGILKHSNKHNKTQNSSLHTAIFTFHSENIRSEAENQCSIVWKLHAMQFNFHHVCTYITLCQLKR